MPNNISISITADVADLVAKRAVMSAELKAATKDLNALAQSARGGMTDELKAKMLAAATAATKLKEEVASVDREIRALRADGEGGGLLKMAEGLKGSVAPITEFRESLLGIGEAVAAAFAVEQVAEFVKKMGEAAEATLHTAQTFGLTIAEVQRMNAQAALFGVPADAMGTAMQRLDKAFATAKQGGVQQANAFKLIGISLTGAYTQTELLNGALEGLGRMEAGPAKIAAAMAMFGRNIQTIGPLLSLTSEQIEEAKGKIDEFGAVNEASAAKGVALAESLNENKVAGLGLGNVMTDALAPVFKPIVDGVDEMIVAFVNSYNTGGQAKTVMEALAFTVKATADVVGLLGAVCVEVFETIDGAVWFFEGVLDPLIDAVVGACRVMWDAFKTFGDVARDALTLNWGAIGADIRSGVARISSDVVEVSKKMGADSAAAFKKGADDWMKGDRAIAGYEAWSKKMWSGAGSSAELPKAGTGTTADNPPGKTKGPSIVSEWTEQLHAQEVASGEFFKDQTANELAFWQSKLALTKQGSRAWIEVQSKIYEASKALAHQSYDDQLAALNQKLSADKDNWSKEQADWAQKLAFIKSVHGEESKEYREAQTAEQAAERQHQQALAQIAREGAQARLANLQNDLKADAAIRKANASTAEAQINQGAKGSPSLLAEVNAASQISALHRQLNQQEIDDLSTTYAKEDALRQADIASALAAYGEDSKAYAEAVAGKAKADNVFFNQRRTLENQLVNQSTQDALKVQQAWRGAMDTLGGSVSSGLSGLAKGTESLGQALANLGDTVIDKVISSLVKWAEEQAVVAAAGRTQAAVGVATHTAAEGAKTAATSAGVAARAGVENTGFFARMLAFLGVHLGAHAATEAAKTAATVTGAAARSAAEVTADTAALAVSKALALSQIATNIALAGSGGVASMAAAPFPIDLTAPAFGAAMAAEAAAFGTIGAFAQGTNVVPADMIAQIHAGERIMPAADNRALMSAVSAGGAGGAQGDVHLHYGPHIHERERISLRQVLASEGGEMITFLHQAVRDGKLKLQPA